jgi:hypothetical protein
MLHPEEHRCEAIFLFWLQVERQPGKQLMRLILPYELEKRRRFAMWREWRGVTAHGLDH